MVELQFINKLLKTSSLALVVNNAIDSEHFITYRDEFAFLDAHYKQYGNVPDRETMLAKFSEFDILDVNESDKYLVDTLKEQYLYSKLVPFVHAIAERVKTDSRDAVSFARGEIEKLSALQSGFRAGHDLPKIAGERLAEYIYRVNAEGLLGISTGISELDGITHGWLGEDLIIIVGRTNEGKTWVMGYFLVSAWKAGKKVLLYSGEMSETLMGFRFDTLNKNFSNEALMHGKKDDLPPAEYEKYTNDLSKSETPFIVVTPKDLGGRKLTVPMLHQLIEQYRPDIVGIDQLSLMDDYRAERGQQSRTGYTHIAEDLFLTSAKYGIPILAPAQGNRESVAKKKSGETPEDDSTPELHHIAESDGIAQNATRVVAIRQLGLTMKLGIKKNRYGKNNQELLVIWDIDRGIVKPFLHVSGGHAQLTQRAREDMGGEELF